MMADIFDCLPSPRCIHGTNQNIMAISCLSGDGIVDCKDTCPKDRENDVDEDSVCGDVDDCPLDEHNDADADDICADKDRCPRDAG